MSNVKLGVLGAGRGLGVTLFGKKAPGFTLHALCDKNPVALNKGKDWMREYGVDPDRVMYFSDYSEMLRSDIDAVFVATDAPLHVEHVLMALEAGKHVLSEIPAVYSIDEAKKLKDAVNAHPELVYMVAENCCYWDFINTWKRMRQDGKFGTVLYAEGEYLHCNETPETAKPYADPDYWRSKLPAIRYLTHELGPLLYIMDDEVESVSCMVPDFDSHPYKTEKSVGIALFKTKKGAVIRIFICFGAYVGFDHNYAIYGSHGMIITDKTGECGANSFARISDIPLDENKMIEIPVGLSANESAEGHGGADEKMLADFISCIKEGKHPMLDVDFGIKISLPGIIAEQSYKAGGALMDIPKIL